MSNFHVGQKVVCWRVPTCATNPNGETIPYKGQVLTIRDVFMFNNKPVLRFEEICNHPFQYGWIYMEACFNAKYFRPVHTTSIEIFEAMLAPTPRKELVRADSD